MKRKETNNKPDAIYIGDVHLRLDQPVCRTDDFPTALFKKLDYISELAREFDCPVYCPGDVFHHWKASPLLLTKATEHLPPHFYTIVGNHDLPENTMDLFYKSGLYTLAVNGRVVIMDGLHWGLKEPTKEYVVKIKGRSILMIHVGVYQGKKPYPGCTDTKTKKILKKYPQYDVILSGHVHQTFTDEMDGRILVNPGSVSRQDADQMDFKPSVFFYYAESNTVKQHFLPIEDGVVDASVMTREHLEEKEERDSRIKAFISKLDSNIKVSLSFTRNLEKLLAKNKPKKGVKILINKALDNGN